MKCIGHNNGKKFILVQFDDLLLLINWFNFALNIIWNFLAQITLAYSFGSRVWKSEPCRSEWRWKAFLCADCIQQFWRIANHTDTSSRQQLFAGRTGRTSACSPYRRVRYITISWWCTDGSTQMRPYSYRTFFRIVQYIQYIKLESPKLLLVKWLNPWLQLYIGWSLRRCWSL